MDRQRVRRDEGDAACRVSGGSRGRWRAIARLARRQHGVVTRQQLLGLGLTSYAIDGWVKSGRLHPLHRGVYLVGHAVGPHTNEMAAVLACGPGAVISHRSAARLWSLLPYPAPGADRDVTVSGRHPGSRPGVRLHRPVTPLDPRDIGALEGIPVTRPARTLIDLGASLGARELERVLAHAYARRLVTRRALQAAVARSARARGAAKLRKLLKSDAGPALTRSEAEERLLDLVRRAKLSPPEANAMVAGYELDFLWRSERLIVEVDGFQFHSSRAAFEKDRLRDAELQAGGFRVMRVTWRQIVEGPEAVVVRIARALTASPS